MTEKFKTIKIGDRVLYDPNKYWASGDIMGSFELQLETIITAMSLCSDVGDKYGEPVQSVPYELKDRCVFILASGHWSYGWQIQRI